MSERAKRIVRLALEEMRYNSKFGYVYLYYFIVGKLKAERFLVLLQYIIS